MCYKQRIAYIINKKINKNINLNKSGIVLFKDKEEFWILCAELQQKKHYSSCEYFYALNDLFKGLVVTFLIVFLIALFKCEIIFASLSIHVCAFTYIRAIQYAEYFVNTVIRNA